MRRRNLVLLLVLVVLAGVGVGVVRWIIGNSGAAEVAWRVQKGMTLKEVEDVIGAPAGVYGERSTKQATAQVLVIKKGPDTPPQGADIKTWILGNDVINVTFDAGGKALEANHWVLEEESLADLIRRWLDL